jgi:hypothetical protein
MGKGSGKRKFPRGGSLKPLGFKERSDSTVGETITKNYGLPEMGVFFLFCFIFPYFISTVLVAVASAALLAEILTVLLGRFVQNFLANHLRFTYALRNGTNEIWKYKSICIFAFCIPIRT